MASVFKRTGPNDKGFYLVAYRDHRGRRQVNSSGTADKQQAKLIAGKLETDAALRRHRVIDPTYEAIERQTQKPIDAHLADYEEKLRTANRTDKHIREQLQIVRNVAEFARFETAADITADGVHRYATELRGINRSNRTIQKHLVAMKTFTNWLSLHKKIHHDPLVTITPPSPKKDRRRVRRFLLQEEWPWLSSATRNGPVRMGIGPEDRLLLYEAAIETGLRSNELRNVTCAKLHLSAKPAYIECPASTTKDGKTARQFISPELTEKLRRHTATKAPLARVFRMPRENRVAEMLRADISSARAAWLLQASGDAKELDRRERSDFLAETDAQGCLMDFHTIRHSCGSWLLNSGAVVKAVQTVLRHSKGELTMDVYGHLAPGKAEVAAKKIRGMMSDVSGKGERQATGTEGRGKRAAHSLAPSLREPDLAHAQQCAEEPNSLQEATSVKSLQDEQLRASVNDNSPQCARGAARIRTGASRICNPRTEMHNDLHDQDLRQAGSGSAAHSLAPSMRDRGVPHARQCAESSLEVPQPIKWMLIGIAEQLGEIADQFPVKPAAGDDRAVIKDASEDLRALEHELNEFLARYVK